MSTGLSPENERFLEQAVASGWFQTRGEALDQAVELLRRRQELLSHIEEGTQQLERGQYTDYDEDGLRAFFDEVKAEGRRWYEAKGRDESLPPQ